MAEQIMWAVKRPDGFIYAAWLQSKRTECLGEFAKWFGAWQPMYRKGYRCIRVRVTEVQDEA